MKKRVGKYPRAFQLMALERMKNCESISALAEELGIHRTALYHWKNHLKGSKVGLPTHRYESRVSARFEARVGR